jgi:hypothetical protein
MSEGQTLMPGDVLATGTVSVMWKAVRRQADTDFDHYSPLVLALAATHQSTSNLAMKSSSRYRDLAA